MIKAPGMAGNCARHSSPVTRVPSARSGTRLAGGGVPWVAQASIASSMARNSIEVRTTFSSHWRTPRVGSRRFGSAKCWELLHRYTRTVAGCSRSLPRVSV